MYPITGSRIRSRLALLVCALIVVAGLPIADAAPASAACPPIHVGRWIGGYTINGVSGSFFGESEISLEPDGSLLGHILSLNGSVPPPNQATGVVNCDQITGVVSGILQVPIFTKATLLASGDEVVDGTWGTNGSFTNGGTFSQARVTRSTPAPASDALDTDTGNTGATVAEPLQVSMSSPNVGDLLVEIGNTANPVLGGYQLLNQVVHIDAPPATATDPLVFTFTLEAASLPAGIGAQVAVFRNGVIVAPCDAGAGTAAIPTPCVAARTLLGDGDVQITVRTAAASVWSFGVPETVIGMRVTTVTLPLGRLGVAYSRTLTASGGTAPYKWKKIGKLPRGLKVNAKTGVLSGVPKRAGTYSFTIQARDSRRPGPKGIAQKAFAIVVT